MHGFGIGVIELIIIMGFGVLVIGVLAGLAIWAVRRSTSGNSTSHFPVDPVSGSQTPKEFAQQRYASW